jgi:hypothetical protein
MAIVQGAFSKLLEPGLKEEFYAAFYNGCYNEYWLGEIGHFIDIANEEGEPIFSEDEPWWVI